MIYRTNKTWSVKPPVAGSRINWRNPLARGLQCAFATNEAVGPPGCAVTGPPVASGALAWTPSFQGSAPLFTASPTSVIRVPMASQAAGIATMSCWAKFTASAGSFLLSLTSTSSNNPIVALSINASGAGAGSLWAYYRNDSLANWTAYHDYVTMPLNDGVWRHLAVVLDTAATHRLYINGVPMTPLATAGSWPVTGATTVNGFCVGGLVRTTSVSYDVAVDQALYWNRALTDAEVASLYVNPWQLYSPAYGPWQFGVSGAVSYSGISRSRIVNVGGFGSKIRSAYANVGD